MVTTLGILAGIAALGGIIVGLLSDKEVWDLDEGEGLLSRLGRERGRMLRSLKDLEFEHEAGTLSTEEFRSLRQEYKRRAIVVSRRLDRLRKSRLRALEKSGTALSTAQKNRIEELVNARRN